MRNAAVQLLTGGLLLLPLSLAAGEFSQVAAGVATSSLLALAYLVGRVVAWRRGPPARQSTSATIGCDDRSRYRLSSCSRDVALIVQVSDR